MSITIEYLWKDRKRYFGLPLSFTRYSLSEDRLFLSVGCFSIKDDEVLVKNEGCVFCNTTDRMIVKNLFATPAYPVAIGHECFGHVVKIGKKVKKYNRLIYMEAYCNLFQFTARFYTFFRHIFYRKSDIIYDSFLHALRGFPGDL